MPAAPAGLLVEAVAVEPDRVVITACADAPGASCPACGAVAGKVHGHYWRMLADLPWHDRRVVWRLRVRRFRCDRCERRTFAERLPDVAAPKARRTGRLARAQAGIGLAVGGEPGARLSSGLAMPVSGDTVLRLVRKLPAPPRPAPRVVGVDDWAWRRGRRYGTIVCDLERRRVVDLLPDRSAAPLRAWLERHLGVAVVSRDKAGSYAEAARTGAPGALQVADRWHLLVNASDALRGVIERHQAKLREAARLCAAKGKAPAARPTPAKPPRPGAEAPDARRRTRFDAVIRLHAQGVPIKRIARRTGVARNAVRRWLRAGEYVPYRRAPGPSLLDRHLTFVEERWRAGQRSSAALWRALQERGFEGGYDIVRRWAKRRRADGGPEEPGAASPSWRVPSSRRAARLLTGDPASLDDAGRLFAATLRAIAPGIRAAADLVGAFGRVIRGGDADALDTWLDAASATPLRSFAEGLRADRQAVRAAVAEPWSNGPVEGQINRLKLIKRQMFGRAKFDLLRQRVLHAA
ncbi:ISL3 family transposase [Craurococcus roseus]|uniref:ISL3 family transposase n=1 Tax=Craurococcus roseus TaxID=77585 RepID=UPI0038D1D52C